MTRYAFLFPILMLVALAAGSVMAGSTVTGELTLDQAQQYNDCMTLARRVPAQAYESAMAWQKQGGGAAAGHCAAVALIGLGNYKPAAQSLEKLAVEQAKAR